MYLAWNPHVLVTFHLHPFVWGAERSPKKFLFILPFKWNFTGYVIINSFNFYNKPNSSTRAIFPRSAKSTGQFERHRFLKTFGVGGVDRRTARWDNALDTKTLGIHLQIIETLWNTVAIHKELDVERTMGQTRRVRGVCTLNFAERAAPIKQQKY